ncbi:hypothetical protein [Breoghania sp. L-A4]|uniref:hypothetical protein n=1 Tax=Breoghania sp. L-A4 TaxID=2304600 RepID=UPI0013C2F9DB|nr:hypothetical protein [Breoghania sp. L-A4]
MAVFMLQAPMLDARQWALMKPLVCGPAWCIVVTGSLANMARPGRGNQQRVMAAGALSVAGARANPDAPACDPVRSFNARAPGSEQAPDRTVVTAGIFFPVFILLILSFLADTPLQKLFASMMSLI